MELLWLVSGTVFSLNVKQSLRIAYNLNSREKEMSKLKLSALYVAMGSALFTGYTANVSAAENEGAEEVERIQVTGSRIKRFEEVSPTPVTVFSGADLINAGITNVADLLDQTPSADIGQSLTTGQGIFGAGVRTTNLRGLGEGRTLVLVNGKRFVASSVTNSAVDLNMIPTAVIKRVEITHGGASAVYGSDAMAGVVNIILEDSYDGFSLDALTQKTQEGEGEENVFALTFGSENEDNSFIFNATYTDIGMLRGRDRDFWKDSIVTMRNPANTSDEDGIPARIYADEKYQGQPQVFGAYDRAGMATLGGTEYVFGENGKLIEANRGLGALPAPNDWWRYYGEDADGYKFLDHDFIAVPLKRLNTFASINKDINDDHAVSLQVAYGRTSSVSNSGPVFFNTSVRVDNPFWHQEAKDIFAAEGMEGSDSIGLSKLGVGSNNRQFYNDQAYYNSTLSLAGVIFEDYDYEIYFQYGRNNEESKWGGELLNDHLEYATDAALIDGSIQCAERDDDGNVTGARAGCEPLNLFGENSPSEAALAYVNTTGTQSSVKSQKVIGGSITGDAFELPAGHVAFALSAEYREEKAERVPGAAMQQNLLFNNFVREWSGEFDVSEIGLEVSIPVLNDAFLAKELTLDVAVRVMDYSTVGDNSAYKVGIAWQPIDEVRVRGTMSKSVRAPELDDLYNTGSQSFTSYSDPCDHVQISEAPEGLKDTIRANCAADGVPVQGGDWRPSEAWRGVTPKSVLGGNPNLKEETSDDKMLGVVYTPTDTLTLMADYWNYKIEDALTRLTQQTIVDNCYRSSNFATNQYCELFDRRDNFDITEVISAPANVAFIEMKGVDLEGRYKLETDFGQFDFRILATYLTERESITDVNDEQYQFNPSVGEQEWPRWKASSTIGYTYEDLYVGVSAQYRHSTVDNREWTIEHNTYNEISSHTEFNLNYRYQLTDSFEVRGSVNNMFDRSPPRNPFSYNGDDGYYDMYGRTFTLGANYKF